MKIKICGLKRREDIEYVNIAKPDYVGFVFAESKRKVTIKEAIELKACLDSNIKVVGVFRNNSLEFVKEVFRSNVIDIIQLHGDEKYILDLKELNCEIIKAYNNFLDADYQLLDGINPGSGEETSWVLNDNNKPVFLAGGINIDNVDKALMLNPYCIDLSSGVETNGIKDFDKIMEIVKKVRLYER